MSRVAGARRWHRSVMGRGSGSLSASGVGPGDILRCQGKWSPAPEEAHQFTIDEDDGGLAELASQGERVLAADVRDGEGWLDVCGVGITAARDEGWPTSAGDFCLETAVCGPVDLLARPGCARVEGGHQREWDRQFVEC